MIRYGMRADIEFSRELTTEEINKIIDLITERWSGSRGTIDVIATDLSSSYMPFGGMIVGYSTVVLPDSTTEDKFALSLAKGIWRIIDAYAFVMVTYLESIPFESYSFGWSAYKRSLSNTAAKTEKEE